MDLQLEGKRALVSGSTLGIGYAIAEALAREGASVIINGRTQARVDEALDKLRSGKVRGQRGRNRSGPRYCSRSAGSGYAVSGSRYSGQ